ncbi:MAG: ATP-binding protein [Sphingomonas sp.]
MSAIETMQPAVRGLVVANGVLSEADPWLADLNARAGGEIGGPLAVPQLAALVRLARRLETPISRGVIAADGERDIDLWVTAEPNGGDVRLTVTGWRQRAPQAPAASEDARDADIVRAGADWLWETDAALHLTYVAVAPEVHDGRDIEALLGQPLTRLFAIDAANAGDPPILRALALRERFDDQPAVVRASGRTVRLAAAPRLDRSGHFAGFIGSARLDDARNEVTAANVFSDRLDRALRGPLGAIIANADAIQGQLDGGLAENYVEYAGDIATAGRHLLGLVDDLVDLQAIERADFHVAAEAIDLADLARRAAGLLQVRASDKQVRIDRPAAGETMPASGEFRRALQILVNLIGNAVRYSPEGSVVWVRAERIEGQAAVIVADQGKGIAAGDQGRIFEKFARVDPDEPGGSGLGLYISRRLAQAMGGDIAVDSAPGQGARFTLTLPARD